MALRRRLLETLILNPTSSNFHRCLHKRPVEKRILKLMIQKRIQKRSKQYPIKSMVPVAHQVLKSWNVLFHGVASLLKAFPVVFCEFCSEVYIGEEGHLMRTCNGFQRQLRNQLHRWAPGGLSDVLVTVEAFHLQKMYQDIILHDQRFDFKRIPAVLELCCQAGANLKNLSCDPKQVYSEGAGPMVSLDQKSVAEVTMRAWESLRHGVRRLILIYPTKACKYCPEVHVGPWGHLVRQCGTFKFEKWRGKHFWGRAKVDNLVPRRIVWSRRANDPPVLVHKGRNFYGRLPAVVDLCYKAGAELPPKYNPVFKIRGLSYPDSRPLHVPGL